MGVIEGVIQTRESVGDAGARRGGWSEWVDRRTSWLQERQYATAYHWQYTRNNLLEYQLRTDVVLELLGLRKSEPRSGPRPKLLDMGCGDGRFLGDAAKVTEAYGVDASARAIEHARRMVPTARVACMSASSLCFPDATFDMVTLLDVIEHIPDEEEARVLHEAHRVLAPGGHLVISTNTDRSSVEWKHHRHYSPERFRALWGERFELGRTVGLIPYFPTLRFWMQAPIAWRLFESRVRTCAPDEGQVIIGIGRKR